MILVRALLGIFAVLFFVALPRQATALDECDFGFKVNTESSALQALTSDANAKGGFWLSINDAPPDIQKIAKYVGLLQTCVMTPDGKPRSVSIGGTTRTINSPQVFKCTASLLSDNRLITNHHCFYDPTFTEAGFNIVTEARVTFGYRFADDTSSTKTYRVLNREISKNQELDALLLQIIGGDANADLGGHFPMDTKGDLQPLQELKMIHHPAGQPQQYSSGTCKVHRLQSQLGEQATSLRHTCETTGGSSGSLILDARSLAIVGLHNLGGLNRQSDSFNAGHRIGPINAAFGLGMKELKPSNDSENLALNIPEADPCDPQFALAKQVNQCAVWDGYLASCRSHSKASEARRLQARVCKVDACDGQFEKAKASNSCDSWKSYAQACGNHVGMLVAEMAVELTCKPVAEEKPAEKSKQVTSTSKPSEATIAGWLKSADAASSRKDYKQAYELLRKAADAGDQCGQHRLGDMYEFGRGLTSSTSSAVYWYKKAVAQNGRCSLIAKVALDRLTKTGAAPKTSVSQPSAEKADPCDPQFALAKQADQCAVWDVYLASCSTHSKASEARNLKASACKVDACEGQFERAKASNSCDSWKSYAQACSDHDGIVVGEMAVELTCKPVAEEFNASHILVATEEEAAALVLELQAGADFAQLAREKSTDPSGPNGGELGWFGAGMMVEPFQEAVELLEVGGISGPVQTQFGWHVIKLNDARWR